MQQMDDRPVQVVLVHGKEGGTVHRLDYPIRAGYIDGLLVRRECHVIELVGIRPVSKHRSAGRIDLHQSMSRGSRHKDASIACHCNANGDDVRQGILGHCRAAEDSLVQSSLHLHPEHFASARNGNAVSRPTDHGPAGKNSAELPKIQHVYRNRGGKVAAGCCHHSSAFLIHCRQETTGGDGHEAAWRCLEAYGKALQRFAHSIHNYGENL